MKQSNMRKAVIDKILLFLVLFISFASIFFMVIDYYVVLKVKENMDNLTHYTIRMVALGKDEDDIITKLNSFNYFSTINSDDLICFETGDNNYTITLTSTTFIDDNRLFSSSDIIFSSVAFFNEVNSSDIRCNLYLSPK